MRRPPDPLGRAGGGLLLLAGLLAGCLRTPLGAPPPRADAGPPQRVLVGNPLRLDGSKSSDPRGERLTYRWTESPKNPVAGTLLETSGARPLARPVQEGVFVFELVVADGVEESAPSTTYVRAYPFVNTPPVAMASIRVFGGTPGPATLASAGDTILLDDAGTFDPDAPPTETIGLHWVQIEGPPVAVEGATGPLAWFVAPRRVATYAFALVADDGSASTGSSPVTATTILSFPGAVFVDPFGGSDVAGCGGSCSPCATLQGGIARAAPLAPGEVYAAQGSYLESATLYDGVSLYGGFARAGCLWFRNPALYPSVLQAGGTTARSCTLQGQTTTDQGSIALYVPPATTSSDLVSVVEGMEILGGPRGTTDTLSVGIWIGRGAVDVRHNHVTGGYTAASTNPVPSAAGLSVCDADPVIEANRIEGSAPDARIPQTIGIKCGGGACRIFNNAIHGGHAVRYGVDTPSGPQLRGGVANGIQILAPQAGTLVAFNLVDGGGTDAPDVLATAVSIVGFPAAGASVVDNILLPGAGWGTGYYAARLSPPECAAAGGYYDTIAPGNLPCKIRTCNLSAGGTCACSFGRSMALQFLLSVPSPGTVGFNDLWDRCCETPLYSDPSSSCLNNPSPQTYLSLFPLSSADVAPANFSGDPQIDWDGIHLKGTSPCLESGADAGVAWDYDDEPRPRPREGETRPNGGALFDVGPDERWPQ